VLTRAAIDGIAARFAQDAPEKTSGKEAA
jgi:hypothetical protein